jgi:RNA polymerase sigma factor (TIGR02999 family)
MDRVALSCIAALPRLRTVAQCDGRRAVRVQTRQPGENADIARRRMERRMPLDAGSPGADARHVTGLLAAARDGAPGAMERLMPLVYDELRRVAHRQLGAEQAGHTLCTTAVVHEAWLRLVDQERAQWADRAHFFAIAARLMRRVLVDYARQHRALRRGGGRAPVSLDAIGERHEPAAAAARADEMIALDEALARLEALDARLARVVELRFYAGLTEEEVASLLGVTARTVRRDWTRARAWLYDEVQRALA